MTRYSLATRGSRALPPRVTLVPRVTAKAFRDDVDGDDDAGGSRRASQRASRVPASVDVARFGSPWRHVDAGRGR